MKSTSSRPGWLAATGNLLGLAISLLMIWGAHQHATWRPWIGGLVTESIEDALWAIDLSLSVQALGHGLKLASRTPFVRTLVELANAVAGLVSVWTLREVYPFDAGEFDGTVRVVLFLALFGVCIAILVNGARLVASSWAPADDRTG